MCLPCQLCRKQQPAARVGGACPTPASGRLAPVAGRRRQRLPAPTSRHRSPQAIYIAPLKALVRERIKDWGAGFCRALGKRMVELTGDYTPDMVR